MYFDILLGSFIVLKGNSPPYLGLEEFVLELLLSENLSALLASADKVRHHSAGGTIRQVFGNFEVFVGQSASYLI